MALFHFTVDQMKRSEGQSAIASAAYRSGKILYEGTPKEIMTNKTLADVFSLDACISQDPWTGKPVCVTYRMKKREN